MKAHVAGMGSYIDKSLSNTKGLRDVLPTFKNQREFQMVAIRAAALSANGIDWVVYVKWIGIEKPETALDMVQRILADATR